MPADKGKPLALTDGKASKQRSKTKNQTNYGKQTFSLHAHRAQGNHRSDKRRFPKFEQFLAHRGHFDYSTATFAIGTAHEFLLISAISFCSVWLRAYQWWFAAFAGYSIHLIVHLAQWAIYRKYIPVIITTILTLPYCVYAFVELAKASILSPLQMLLWAVIGIVLTVLSLLSAFFVMSKFQNIE